MAHFPAHHDHSPQRGRGGVSRYPDGAQLFGGNNVKCQTAFPFMCRVTSMWGRWTALSPTFSQALTEQPGRRGLSIVPGGCALLPLSGRRTAVRPSDFSVTFTQEKAREACQVESGCGLWGKGVGWESVTSGRRGRRPAGSEPP